MISLWTHKVRLGFLIMHSSWLCATELLMPTIFTSNLDSNQFISQPLPTLTTCSSYLIDTQSPVSRVAVWRLIYIQDSAHQLAMFWSPRWIIVRKYITGRVAPCEKWNVKPAESVASETFRICRNRLIFTEALLCWPDTVSEERKLFQFLWHHVATLNYWT